MFKLGGVFVFCFLYPFLYSPLLSFLNVDRPLEGTLIYFLLSIMGTGWPVIVLTSALFWAFCSYSKKPPSAVWQPVVITVIVAILFAVMGFGFNDASPVNKLGLPKWVYGFGLASCIGLTVWMQSTKPFAVLRDHRPDLILLILLVIPPLFLISMGFLVIASMIAADM